ncbi:MAG: hypothetical protein WD929_08495 [Steroidobacteraceae bacterium]
MEQAPDGIESHLLAGASLDAANDPVIADPRPATGWDPFEVWRTRVRGLRLRNPGERRDSTD